MGYAGHYDHFLERLSRIDDDQVDFAMSLYYDPHFVRAFLRNYDIPDGYDRVAVAIDEGPDSPHIVLARDGAFVTCLGVGMSIKGLFRIPYVDIERRHDLHKAMGESLERAHQRGWRTGGVATTLKRKCMKVHAHDFARLQALCPLLLDRALMATQGYPASLLRRRRILTVRLGRKLERLPGRYRQDVENYWRDFFYLHHMSLLAAIGTEQLAALSDDFTLIFGDAPWWSWREGMLGPCLRAIWCAGRMGAELGDYWLKNAREATGPRILAAATAFLATIALRHPEHYHPVLRLFRGWRDGIAQIPEDKRRPLQSYKRSVARMALSVLENVEDAPAFFLRFTQANYTDFIEDSGRKPDDLLGQPDDLSAEQALGFTSLYISDIRQEPLYLGLLLSAVPLLARADAADMYPPRRIVSTLDAWTPEFGATLFRAHALARPTPDPVTVEETPGRNDPCSCGRGRKYKRCCLRKSATV